MARKFYNMQGKIYRAALTYIPGKGLAPVTSVHGPYTRQGDATQALTREAKQVLRYGLEGREVIGGKVQVGTVEWTDLPQAKPVQHD